jgi:pimeloyl-ACP methyl ester carboxylesterase
MPTIDINGAHLHCAVYGQAHAGKTPILLIHGSLIDGETDWSVVAPLLAQRYTVIVPDCRGHGHSDNPGRTYSFRQLADDAVSLVRALGYERAYVIGHSNGGNVALVALLEYPDAVQACIAQAANAYITPHLIEREPVYFDADRIEREEPARKTQLIALHEAANGAGYWRDLLALTLAETVSAPNYTTAQLAQVSRPVLAIQGEQDAANAPDRHAQFIAGHIPRAELWAPAGVGHNVHRELPCEWVARVFDFLARRGDDANDALYRLRETRYRDGRNGIFAPQVEDGGRVLAGQVMTEDDHRAVLAALPAAPAEDRLSVLLDAAGWGIIQWNVSDLRRAPGRLKERVSQALVGEVVRILEERDGWAHVRLTHDGYLGWVQIESLHRCTEEGAAAYVAACDALVCGELPPAYTACPVRVRSAEGKDAPENVAVGKLPFGAKLPLAERCGGWAALRLPDGSLRWCTEDAVLPVVQGPQPDAAGIAAALQLIRRFAGVPYLWGGRSPFGFDCSGLAQAFWRFLGAEVPRDADQQFSAGRPVESAADGSWQPGDLLFFADDPDETSHAAGRLGHISHVAISLGGSEFIHANVSAGCVSYNSFDPSGPRYRRWLAEHLAGARRFDC